jgi:glucosamine 6-phosphate synthetase-like amidotransferase/phosphosugar isomerase protein
MLVGARKGSPLIIGVGEVRACMASGECVSGKWQDETQRESHSCRLARQLSCSCPVLSCLALPCPVSPLCVSLSQDEFFVASDASAVVEHTKSVVYLEDGEIVVLRRGEELQVHQTTRRFAEVGGCGGVGGVDTCVS